MQYWQFLSGGEQLQNVNLNLIFEDIDIHELLTPSSVRLI